MFIVTGPGSASGASEYIDYYGVDFGFRTNDADNSAGSSYVVSSDLFYGVPWVGVIRTSDMTLYRHDAEWGSFDLRSIAEELGR